MIEKKVFTIAVQCQATDRITVTLLTLCDVTPGIRLK